MIPGKRNLKFPCCGIDRSGQYENKEIKGEKLKKKTI
jgi:hypothetical protein